MRKTLLVAAALLIASPAVSQADTLEDLLVEKGVITKAEAKGAMGSSGAKTWWNEGTRFEFPDNGFTSSFATHLESRYTYFDTDQDVTDAGDTSSFDVTRARVVLSGSAMHNEFSYYMNADFAGAGDNVVSGGGTNLLDAWLQWNACDWGSVRLGQYKTFVSRQFNTEDYKLQFPDRTLASQAFNAGRQQGLSGMFNVNEGMFNINAGIFNGTSDGEGINSPGVDNDVGFSAGARYNMGGIDPYSEADVNHSDEFGLTAGIGYYYDAGSGNGVGDRDQHLLSLDVMMKIAGFSLAAEYYYFMLDPDDGSDNVEPMGFYVQGGYFLMPKKFEIAARYGYIDCDDGAIQCVPGVNVGIDSMDEAGLALNYYFWAHNLKASLSYNYIRINPEDSDLEDADLSRWIFAVSGYF